MELRAKINRVGVEVLMAENPTQYGYHHGPIYPGENLVISSTNTQVCDVVVTAHGEMCGMTFSSNSNLYRHIRLEHPEFRITIPAQAMRSPDEKRLGRNAIKRWVLDGGWRRARYIYEPRELHQDSLIMQYADSYKLIAECCADFRDMFGASFHRPEMAQESSSDAQV